MGVPRWMGCKEKRKRERKRERVEKEEREDGEGGESKETGARLWVGWRREKSTNQGRSPHLRKKRKKWSKKRTAPL